MREHLQSRRKEDDRVHELKPKITVYLTSWGAKHKKKWGSSLPALADTSKPKLASGQKQRWWNNIAGDMSYINDKRPPVGSVFKDDMNGRFRISYGAHVPRSISWTKIGLASASGEVLRQLWRWHSEASDTAVPPELA